jgi:hypothetical protein
MVVSPSRSFLSGHVSTCYVYLTKCQYEADKSDLGLTAIVIRRSYEIFTIASSWASLQKCVGEEFESALGH